MRNFRILQEVEAELLSRAPNRMLKADYKLERVRLLAERVGNPQNELKVVHVTGTSGKTSTAYYMRALLEATGASVGLTVSPHIKTTCERIQIGGKPISEELFVQYFNEFFPLVDGLEPRPTYFELMTVFAYWVFKKEQLEYAVVEVGLGGRFDATNIVNRADKVCIINSIGYDHTEILGETLTAIAGEKAGITQEENAVFTVPQEPEAQSVLEAEAQKKHAHLNRVSPAIDQTSSVPPFQQHNFALARAAVEYIVRRDDLKLPTGFERLMDDVVVPGRFELYTIGAKTVVLDGAHNPQKLAALVEALAPRKLQPALVVMALSEAPEKKIAQCIGLVESFAERVIYTTFAVQRDVLRYSVRLEKITEIVSKDSLFINEPTEAFAEAMRANEPFIIITGSLYLVSLLRPLVQREATLSD